MQMIKESDCRHRIMAVTYSLKAGSFTARYECYMQQHNLTKHKQQSHQCVVTSLINNKLAYIYEI